MDCSICTTMPFILRPPRNTICAACYEGARSLISLINKFDGDINNNNNNNHKCNEKSGGNNVITSSNSSCKGFGNVLKWVKEMKDIEEELNDKLKFLGEFEAAFRDEIHTDILVKPGNNGPPIPAHRALLAAKSEIFRNMLDSDGCKEAPNEAITLPELNHEELESLLMFLYNGSLPIDKVEKHVYSLSVAADKYNITFLQKFCERQMLNSLSSSNALDILEISDVCSNLSLKDTSLNFIVKNMEDIVFSPKFEAFSLKNPHLSVQITRASLMDLKNRRNPM
ncbi:BTB/POZ domain-containing protein At3g56230-like [Amaranthus tricolor]|uniref:BTB/POZ domain-containing protein At3g56230-like n=1 Tax=Amaranthus tricolor TaxID=29722 RepID=UPI002585C0C2|nr:BTB/POZ domain-containing protein At3g56230-like [Amaranthus tricolor]